MTLRIEYLRPTAQGLGAPHRQALNHAQGACRPRAAARHHHARHASGWHRLPGRVGLSLNQRRGRDKLPSGVLPREGMGDGADSVACGRSDWPTAVCNQATPYPAHPIECHRARRERRSHRHRTIAQEPSRRPLTPLENSIDPNQTCLARSEGRQWVGKPLPPLDLSVGMQVGGFNGILTRNRACKGSKCRGSKPGSTRHRREIHESS